MFRFRSVALGVAAALGLAPAVLGADTPTLGPNADCWQNGTPYWCRTHYHKGSNVIFQAIDYFSAARPAWLSPAQAAVSAWNSAAGPQVYTWASSSSYNKTYLLDSVTGSDGLTASSAGLTWNCNASGSCNDTVNQAGWNVDFSRIYFNRALLDTYSAAKIQNVFAHESGHAMGLFHNASSATLMYPYVSTIPGPKSPDIGAYPGCASGGAGVRCVFGEGD